MADTGLKLNQFFVLLMACLALLVGVSYRIDPVLGGKLAEAHVSLTSIDDVQFVSNNTDDISVVRGREIETT